MLAGFVERRAGRNKREAAFHLTAAGEEQRTKLLAARLEGSWEILGLLDRSEWGSLRTPMQRILDRFELSEVDTQRLCRQCDRSICSDCPAHKPGRTEWRFDAG